MDMDMERSTEDVIRDREENAEQIKALGELKEMAAGYGFDISGRYALEMPDTRRWETLPLWLQVARVPCPPDLSAFDVVYRGKGGNVVTRQTIERPLARKGDVFVSFCRGL